MAFGPEGGGFDLSWNTIDGGGGSPLHGASTGGGFSLSGTIGQPDATPGNVLIGVSGRTTYTLTGGFWAARERRATHVRLILTAVVKSTAVTWGCCSATGALTASVT